jgi:hypothetical protein
MKSGQSMRIGDTGWGEWMNGQMDDVRVYNKALSTAELRRIGGFLAAYDPIPADEASGVSAATTIDWLAGPLAASHNVYFGTSYADVKAGTGGTFKGPQPLADHDYDPPGALEAGKLYYWKIDEVNDLHLDKKWEGPVWVFRVAGGAGGLLGSYYHHTGEDSPAGFETFILNRIDPEINFDWGEGSPDPSVNVDDFTCRWTGQVEAPFSEDYIFYPATDDGVHLWVDGQLVVDEWWTRPTTEGASAPIALVAGQKYDIVMEQYENDGGAAAYLRWSSPSISKRIIPPIWLWPSTKASNPVPPNGSTGAPLKPTLSWVAGVYAAAAAGHRVYFDANELKVIAGVDCQVNGVSTTNPTYGLLPTFGLEETYYWRIDEVNGVKSWRGDVWSFTTANNKVIDDMEKYVPGVTDPNIYKIWVDGAGDCASVPGNNSGALVDTRLTPVHGDQQAMMLVYDNDGTVNNPCPPGVPTARLTYSKVEAQVAKLPSGIGSDWTLGGVAKALSLQFYGDPFNSIEPMWVQLTDASNNKAKVFYGKYADEDVNDMKEASWHEWLIDLEDFTEVNDVNVSDVKSIAIGVGDEEATSGVATGTLYFDDIGLYAPRCVLTRRSADFAIVDYVRDCVVDYKEVEVMAENWLAAAGTVPNGDFELLYKPGTAITGNVSQWTQGVGPDCPIDTGEYVFSDGTTGTVADIPGWIGADRQGWIDNGGTYDRDQTTGNLQGSISDEQNFTEGGLQCYLANGGDWDNPAGGLIVSDAPLRNVEDGIYTLSMMANGDATPVVLELLAGGIILTPTSSVNPVLSGDWQEFSRTYDSASLVGFLGEPLTIRLGVGRGASGGQTRFDNVTLFHSEDKKINFKDFAELAVWWLDEQLWP